MDHTKGRIMYRNMEEEKERKKTTKSLTLGFTGLKFLLDVQMRMFTEYFEMEVSSTREKPKLEK